MFSSIHLRKVQDNHTDGLLDLINTSQSITFIFNVKAKI